MSDELARLSVHSMGITEAAAALYTASDGERTAFVSFDGSSLSVLVKDPDAADQIAAAFTEAARLLREAKAAHGG